MNSKRVGVIALISSAMIAGLFAGTGGAGAAPGPRGDYIVVLDDGVESGAVAAEHARRHGAEVHHVYRHALRGYAATMTEAAAAGVSRDPRVAWVERDQVATVADQTVPTGVQRVFAPGNSNLDIDSTDDERVDVDVAVIDTGIDLDHPDLDVNVAGSVNCLNWSGNGRNRTYSCLPGGDDDHYHGTHVAGTVGALDNGIGVVGVAPGARLWAVKVLDARGSGPIAAIVAGIDYVTGTGEIEVANMSLGCECSSAAMNTAIAASVAAGVTYVVAAGNSDMDASTFSPANHPDVITVSALADFDGLAGGGAPATCRSDEDDTLASFSNFGSLVEIAAPGVCILSTYPNGSYGTISGTSMASPHVAGAAALLASASGTQSPGDIRATLIATGNFDWTDDSGDGTQEPLLDVSDATVFDPVTVAGGGTGGGGGTEPPASGIDLDVTAYKVRGVQHADLTWSGATSTSVDVYRDSALIAAATTDDGAYTDNVGSKGGGSYTYKVCEAGTSICSNEVTVTF